MIKPEDISDEAFNYVYERELYEVIENKGELAGILNAAIKAGIVSPPCWVYRYTGCLNKSGNVVELYPKRIHQDDQFGYHEHWKGQTE